MQRSHDPPSPASLYTDRSFLEIAQPYQTRTKGRRTFDTVQSRENGDHDGDTVLHKAASLGEVQDVHDLLRLGADVNAAGDMGYTPLHGAAMAGHTKVVEVLIDAGANISIRSEFGETPVETAVRNGHEDLARKLRRAAKLSGRRV